MKAGTTEQRARTVATLIAFAFAFAASVAVVAALLLFISVTGAGLASGELLVPLALIVVGTIVGGRALRRRL